MGAINSGKKREKVPLLRSDYVFSKNAYFIKNRKKKCGYRERTGISGISPVFCHFDHYGVLFSFTNYNMFNKPEIVGLLNYKRLLQDNMFKKSVVNTLKYSFFTLVPQLFLAVIIANALFIKSKLVALFRLAMYVPYVISMVW